MSVRSDVVVQVDALIPTLSIQLPTSVSKVINHSSLTIRDGLKAAIVDDESSVTSNINNSDDPETEFNKQLTSYGGFYQLKSSFEIFDKISYRVLNDTELVLTPLVIFNHLNVDVRKVKYIFPGKIVSNCLSISQNGSSSNLIIDVLLESNTMVTVSLNLNYLLTQTSNDTSYLDLQDVLNFYNWCNYSIPYSFDVRPPLFMKSVNNICSTPSIDLILSLKDGGLLKLSRPSNEPFEPFFPVVFNDNSYFQNLKSKIFHSDSSHGSNVIINIDTFDDLMITMSMNKKLKIWSIENKTCILERDLNDFLPQLLWSSDLSLYNNINTDLLNLLPIGSSESNSFYISVVLPLGETYFKLFKLDVEFDSNGVTLKTVNLSETSVESVVPGPSEGNNNWLCHNFKIYNHNDDFIIYISWIFNNFKFLQQCQFNIKEQENSTNNKNNLEFVNCLNVNNQVSEIVSTNLIEATRSFTTSDECNDFFIDYFFNGLAFNSLIVSTALSLFRITFMSKTKQKANVFTFGSNNSTRKTAKSLLLQIVNNSVESTANLQDLINQWIKFEFTCKELLRLSQNPVNFMFEKKSNYIFMISKLDYVVYKTSSNLNLISNGYKDNIPLHTLSSFNLTNTTSVHKLIELVSSFKKSFSNDVIFEFEKLLIEDYASNNTDVSVEKRMDDIYTSHIVPRVNESIVGGLLAGLNSIPDVLQSIDMLISLPIMSNDDFSSMKHMEAIKFNNFEKNLFLSNYLNELLITKDVIIGLLFVILTVDINEQMIDYYGKLMNLLKTMNLNLLASKVSLSFSNSPSKSLVSKVSHSLLFDAISAICFKDSHHTTLNDKSLNDFSNHILQNTMSDDFIYYILSKLISYGPNSLTTSRYALDLIAYLPVQETAIGQVLKGLVLLNAKSYEQSFSVFSESADLIIDGFNKTPGYSYTDDVSLKPIFKVLEKFIISITPQDSKKDVSKIIFFIDLSDLFKERGSSLYALNFVLKSMELNNKNVNVEEQQLTDLELKLNRHHFNQLKRCFQLSLDVGRFELAHQCILDIEEIEDHRNESYTLIKLFILKLLSTGNIEKLLSFTFGKDCNKVDEIFYNMAEEMALKGEVGSSLRYYRICYSWRYCKLKDYRNASQALYRFNKIYELDKLKRINQGSVYEELTVRLIENYTIILNALRILPEDERWLVNSRIDLFDTPVNSLGGYENHEEDNEGDASMNGSNNSDKTKVSNTLVTYDEISKEYQLVKTRLNMLSIK